MGIQCGLFMYSRKTVKCDFRAVRRRLNIDLAESKAYCQPIRRIGEKDAIFSPHFNVETRECQKNQLFSSQIGVCIFRNEKCREFI